MTDFCSELPNVYLFVTSSVSCLIPLAQIEFGDCTTGSFTKIPDIHDRRAKNSVCNHLGAHDLQFSSRPLWWIQIRSKKTIRSGSQVYMRRSTCNVSKENKEIRLYFGGGQQLQHDSATNGSSCHFIWTTLGVWKPTLSSTVAVLIRDRLFSEDD